jgi:hypothetical protein
MEIAFVSSARLMASHPLYLDASCDFMIWTDRNVCPTLLRDLFLPM